MKKIVVLDHSQVSAEVLAKLREHLLSEAGVELVDIGEVRERDYLPRTYDLVPMAPLGEDPVERYYPKQDKPSWSPGFGAPCKRGRKKGKKR